MTKSAFEKIAASTRDAIAIARGEANPDSYRLHVPVEVNGLQEGRTRGHAARANSTQPC